MMSILERFWANVRNWSIWSFVLVLGAVIGVALPLPVQATPFTTTVPNSSITLPAEYPEAGGVVMVYTGLNGNIYYQFSNPAGAFRGFNSNGQPSRFRGNPFTINDPLTLDCGFALCVDYFGGGIASLDIRFSAYDGDTQPGGFDNGDIELRLNGVDVGSWSGITTERTNTSGTQSQGFATGFGNNTFNTAWFRTTNQTLLNNILTSGEVTTQVYDRDPNDNYWDFRRGNNLANPDIVTVAPGYDLVKTADKATFAAVGEIITYSYVVSNIGSVPIRNLSVTDDKISNVECLDTVILDVPSGTLNPDSATCTGEYTVTQADFDAQKVTNIASAQGTPDFGVLGVLTDTVEVTGPVTNPSISLSKTSAELVFGNEGTVVNYNLVATNDGDTTLTNVVVSDPQLPGLSCSVATLLPLSVDNTDNTLSCSGTYTVLQSDVDNWIVSATQLENTATVTAVDPAGGTQTDSDQVLLNGPAAAPSLILAKSALSSSFSAENEVIQYRIELSNNGNVTFPAPPTITDSLGIAVTCPAGPVSPNTFITCSASYSVLQSDVDAGQIDNTVSTSITLGGVTVSDTADASVPAVQTTGLTLDKRLTTTSPTSFDEKDIDLFYEYELKNTGNVTLDNIAVTDVVKQINVAVPVTCPVTTLGPDQSTICTSAAYATIQGNITRGEVTNEATANATARISGDAVASNEDTVTVPAVQNPSMELTKTAPTVLASDFVVGNTITYTYSIENTGNIRIASNPLNATKITITDDKIGTFDCVAVPLTRGAIGTCTQDYVIQQSDIEDGLIVNLATANAEDANGDSVLASNQAQATVAPNFSPSVTVAKSADVAVVDATTDTINYTFTVTNSGDATLSLASNPITINDPKISNVDCSAAGIGQPSLLAVGASFDCSGSYSPTQAELDIGSVENSATASFPFTNAATGSTSTITSAADDAIVGVVENLSMVFNKTPPAEYTSVDELITYSFSAQNTSNVTLTTLVITDANIPALACSFTDVAPTQTVNCTGEYQVTQDDIDEEEILNTATATGTSQTGGQVSETDTGDVDISPAGLVNSITVLKTANKTAFTTVGEEITYSIEVTNTGKQTLSNTLVTDSLDPVFSCTIPTLAPNAQNDLCFYIHKVTQDDIDAGEVINLATGTNPEVSPQTSTITIPGPTRTADFMVEKTADTRFTAAGQFVNFTFEIKNTGNVRLSNVLVTDASIFSPAETCNIGTLEPMAVDTSCVVQYQVTQNDVDVGEINNTGTVTAEGVGGALLSKDASETVDGPTENASLLVLKQSTDGIFSAPTDSETYTFSVTNDGNVTLTNLVLNDADLQFNCALPNLIPGQSTALCADGTTALTATKLLDQDNVDDGSYVNEVEVVGESLVNGTAVTGSDEVTIIGPAQTVALSIAKASTLVGNFDALNQEITYQYTVTNDSNITLTANVSVSDDKIANVTCPATPAAGVPPGGTVMCSAIYEVTQADLDAGNIFNTASATVTQPVVPANPIDPSVVTVTSADDTLNIGATQTPTLTLDKRLTTTSLGTYQNENDEVSYEYFVVNTGNVTIEDDILVFDDKFGTDLVCSTDDLAPMGEITCEQTYTVLQSDVNAGSVTNTAQAYTGVDLGSATLTSNQDSVTVTAIQSPELTIVKEYVPEPVGDPQDAFTNGEDLNYKFTITNSGNVTIALNPATVVNDNRITPFTCAGTPATLDPGASHECSGIYIITPDDLALGAVTNIATANGTFDGDNVVSPTDDAIFPTDAMPAISIEKLADVTTFTAVGDKINYTYNVRNTGNTDLSTPGAVTDDKFPNPLSCIDPTGGVFERFIDEPTEIATCSQEYSVTQDDLDAGFVTNEAFALTSFGALPVQSPAAVVTVTGDVEAELLLTKSVSPDTPADVGDILTYTLTATASGNQRVFGVEITDPLIGALTCLQGTTSVTTADLDPNGDPLICSGQLTVTQAMLDDQEVVNTAGARGSSPDGTNVVTEAENTLDTVAANPELMITKTITPEPSGVGDPSFATIDQDVTFIVTVKNIGNITLNNINITDDLVAGTCAVGTLAPGEDDNNCQFVVTTVQSDVDNGSIVNTATASFEPATGGTGEVSDDETAFGPDAEPAFALNKLADVSDFDEQGDIITYTYRVANAGNVTLFEQPVVVDDKIGTFNCGTIPSGGLLPLESITCTQTYAVTQGDVDTGFVTNIASATSSEVTTPATATETVDAIRSADVNLTKVASIPGGKTEAAEGDLITYTYTVTNTGNVTLSTVGVSDDHTSAAGTNALTIAGDTLLTDNAVQNDSTDTGANGSWDSLAPQDVATFTSTYLVTQADVDAGNDLSNTATVSGAGPPNVDPVEDQVTVNVPVEDANPIIDVNKTVTNFTGVAANDTITFRIEVANTGNVTLDNVVLTDTLTRADNTSINLTTGPGTPSDDNGVVGDLEVGETWAYTATYVLTQEDIDAGGVLNSALAESTAPDGTPTNDRSGNGLLGGGNSPTPFIIAADPSIEAIKEITSTTVEEGETVSFSITVQNTGNVTLTDVGIQSDTLTRSDVAMTPLTLTTEPTFSAASAGSPVGTLKPNETATYLATYLLVQEDIDAGGITNSATAVGTPPAGSPITDVSDDGDPSDGADNPTVLIVPSDPSLELEKKLATGQAPNFNTLDAVINYEFVVTNTGNISLPGPFIINDAKITDQGNVITCPTPAAPGLMPNDALSCFGSYSITQDDLDLGEFVNSATVDDGVSPTSDPSEFTLPAIQNPEMTLAKVAQTLTAAEFIAGAKVTYTYTVTNSGNVTLNDPITINDNLIPSADFVCPAYPAEGIAPTGTYVCTAEYTITANDVFLGSVTNIATSTDGTTTSAQTSETIPDQGDPLLEIVKTAEAGASFSEVGDKITYTFEVTNGGTRAFARDVIVSDSILDNDIVCFEATGSNSFNAGDVVSCTGEYTVDQDDLDAGEVFNEAFAQTEFNLDGETTEVVSPPADVTVDADLSPELTIVKTADPSPITAVGQNVTYTITVTNTGNQTLNTIRATDPLLPGLACEADELLRGDILTCSDTYTVLQSDIDAGELVNTADAIGQTPDGTEVDDTTSVTTDVPDADPSVTVEKTATPSDLGAVGSLVSYRFDVTNTGNVTLSDLVVTDALDNAYECTIASLAPTLNNQTCTFEVEVTQDMIDEGGVENTASVTGRDPNGTDVIDTDTVFTPGPARVPSLVATKTASVVGTSVGQIVTYSLTVENTGNVTLDVGTITDTMRRRNNVPTALDAPFVLRSGDLDNNDLLGVNETWVYEAFHTITQSDVNGGGFNNTVTVNANGPDGTPVSDVSDDGDDSDGNAADDPTEVLITSDPSMNVTKTITQSGSVAGDEVIFVIEAINTGNVDITISALPTDTLTRADGTVLTPVGPTRLSTGDEDGDDQLETAETLRWQVSYTLVQADIDALGISNTVTVSGTAANGDPVSDVSDDGDDSDGNITDDSTDLDFAPVPGIETIKSVATSGNAVGDTVAYDITVRNIGNLTLSGVGLSDTLTRSDDTVLTLVGPTFVPATPAGSAEGTLLPGEVATYRASYTLIQADIDAGGISNTATATGTSPSGVAVTDVSDDPNATVDTGPSDPALIVIDRNPSLLLSKTVTSNRALFPTIREVVFNITATNNGNVTHTNVQLLDDLNAFASPAEILTTNVVATGFTTGNANASFTGTGVNELLSGTPSLAPGETGTIVLTTTYSTENGVPSSGENTVIGTTEQSPTPVSGSVLVTGGDTDGDGSDDGFEGCTAADDRDGDGICDAEDYDPTGYFYCEEDGRILTGGLITVTGNGFTQTGVGNSGTIRVLQGGTNGFYQFDVTAPGTYTISYTNPIGGVPSTSRLGVTAPTPISNLVDVFTGTTTTNPRLLGASQVGASGNLASFTLASNPVFYTTFTIAPGDPNVFSNNLPFQACTTPGALEARKSVIGDTDVRIGDRVNYQLEFQLGATGGAISNATVVDILPKGIIYQPGSAMISLNGGAVIALEPAILGGRLSWVGQNIPQNSTLRITYFGRVSPNAPLGKLTNTTFMTDVSGVPLSNRATAVVERVPEHVFDCSDVIGKVFDDQNHNGYHDQGEPGIPNARVVTVRGTRITTDEFGRFHVPCAETPGDIGTNFILKLDTRSLPTGYRVTTENPRVQRLTAGKFAKINFGATISKVIRIELNENAFTQSGAVSPAFERAIRGMVSKFKDRPSVVRLTYLRDGNVDQNVASQRLKTAEKMIKAEWRKRGQFKLNIERTIKRRN